MSEKADTGLLSKENGSHLSDRRSSRYQYSRPNLDNLDEIQKSTENRINMHKSVSYYCEYVIMIM